MTNDSISLKDRIIESSYKPIIIDYSAVLKLPAHTENSGSQIVVFDFEHELTEYPFIKKFESRILLEGYSPEYYGARFDFIKLLKRIYESINNGIISFLKGKELKEAKVAYNEFINSSRKTFNNYEKEHEKFIQSIDKDAHNINRQKTLMKGYLLNNLYKHLMEIGIETSFNDWPDEFVDLRRYPINNTYNLIKQHHIQSQKIAKSLWDVFDLNPYVLIFKRLKNTHKIKKIQSELKDLERSQQYINEQIYSDLDKLEILHKSLSNITNIYKDTTEVLGPILEKLLEELKWSYGQKLTEMPTEKVEAIRKIKDILRDLTEVLIIPQEKELDEVIATVAEFNNNMSRRHSKLKSEMLAVA